MSGIKKQDGLTPSEQYLNQLCERTFLKLWSYPNVFRMHGKELCDLLVVFENDVIIFSDKSCQFPNSGDLQRDWDRWYRRSVERSVAQVYGAERWIREHPTRVFLDAKCTQPFPLQIGDPKVLRFHRIVVAIGACGRCREHLGGSGSLRLYPRLSERDSDLPPNEPFVVGCGTKDGGLIHIFDDVTLDTVLSELDTVFDFVMYLRRKEALISSGKLKAAPGEENLLAYYLSRYDQKGEHDFAVPEGLATAIVGEDLWEVLQEDALYIAEKEANRSSYVWDELIEFLTSFILDGTATHPGPGIGAADHEKRVRALASASRRTRRILGSAMVEFFSSDHSQDINVRAMTSSTQPYLGYVFLLMAHGGLPNYEAYREARRKVLFTHCIVYKWKNPQLRSVVGVAGEPRGATGVSEDIIHIDECQWTPELASTARSLQRKLRIFMDAKKRVRVDTALSSALELPVRLNRHERRARSAKARQKPQ
jgi:hypothetical protein